MQNSLEAEHMQRSEELSTLAKRLYAAQPTVAPDIHLVRYGSVTISPVESPGSIALLREGIGLEITGGWKIGIPTNESNVDIEGVPGGDFPCYRLLREKTSVYVVDTPLGKRTVTSNDLIGAENPVYLSRGVVNPVSSVGPLVGAAPFTVRIVPAGTREGRISFMNVFATPTTDRLQQLTQVIPH